jgi:hypothetical protein
MKYFIYILGVLVFCFEPIHAQNIITNPSFTELDSCTGFSPYNIHHVRGWHSTYYNPNSFDSLGSTDYFTNECDNHWWGQVPLNFLGYQEVRLQKNYGGFAMWTLDFLGGEYREGIQNYLKESLINDSVYIVQFYISLADSMDIAINRFELKFTNERFTTTTLAYDSNAFPDLAIYNPHFYSDQINWMKVQGEYVAKGGEQWLSIGNFSSNFTFDTMQVQAGDGLSYYYIDDVSLYLKSTPVFHADAGTDEITCAENEVVLSTTERESYYYFWLNLQGDTLGTSAQLTVNPTQTTTYILSQWDFKFDQTWDTVTVFVEPNCPELWLPTWFAPTQSQYWHPQWRDLEYWEVTVYNSLGQVVHRYTGTPEQHPGWDGTSIATGVYHAVVNARAYNGEQLRAVEKVMLLR